MGVRSLALLLFLCAAAAGCTGSGTPAGPEGEPTPSTAPEPTPGDVCVTGRVLDPEMLPIASASVAAVDGGQETTTAQDGTFTLCGLAEGTVRLVVQRLGYESAAKAVQAPGTAEFILEPIAILEERSELFQASIFYTAGLSTLDTTTSRYGVNLTTCGPCTFEFYADGVPDFIVFELDWTRTVSPVGTITESMYHILRAGIPFSEGSDVGSGSMAKPFKFVHNREAMTGAGAAVQDDGLVPFSGSAYCWGSPAWPCVDQRIDAYISMLWDYPEVPADFTAIPPE